MNSPEKEYDLIIVGAGIAGLSIAEIFSRSGQKVLLIEKNEQICQEASGAHHGWFHFGSLYSIFPSNQFLRTLVGGIDDLLKFYTAFPGMNIYINKEGKLDFKTSKKQWFRDEPIEYIVSARNNPDFALKKFEGLKKYARKIFFLSTWELAIKQFISRHRRFHKFKWGLEPASKWIPQAGWLDYTRDVISKPQNTDTNLDVDTHFRIVGFDRPMIAPNIIADLLRSFLGNGGALKLGESVIDVKKSEIGLNQVITENGTFISSKVIVAGGHYTQKLLGERADLKVMISPLLITYPNVCDDHFVRLTPFVEKSVNHIWHEIEGKKYSVIGGGYFADPNNIDEIAKAKNDLLEMAKSIFPKFKDSIFSEVYFSHKTELVPKSGERNYQYHVRDIDNDIYMVLPGKFSLGFSLAVNIYEKIMKTPPCELTKFDPDLPIDKFVKPMRHGQIVSDFINQT